MHQTEKEAIGLPVKLLESKFDTCKEEFRTVILGRMRNDDIGNLAQSDPTIVYIGSREFLRTYGRKDKYDQCVKRVRQEMRLLAYIYRSFLAHSPGETSNGNALDLFSRANFSALEEAIHEICKIDEESIKYGKKTGIQNILRRHTKLMKARFLVEKEDDLAAEIDRFSAVFEFNAPILFGDSNYLISRNRVENLLKPQRHPIDSDVRTLRDGISKQVEYLTSDPYRIWTARDFIVLRDCVCSRLTLFNARRGGEPARLTLKEYREGVNGTWLGEALSRRESDFSKSTMHVTYQTGKGRTHMVPVLFPNDMLKALAILAMPDIREACGVHPSNNFLFPSTQLSQGHVNGWNATHSSCKMAGVKQPGRLTATTMRHRVSTKYAALKDVPEHERHLFYNHMGHSAEMNKNVYQTPLAEAEIDVIGRRLQAIDQGKMM